MRAVAVPAFRSLPSVMEVVDPNPGPGEIGIRLDAAGVNPFDWKIADGILAGRPHVFPLVLGVDGAGIVEELGAGARRFTRGDRVFGHFLHDPVGRGTYAPRTIVPETIAISRIPAGLTPVQAAALPTAGMTALASVDALSLAPGASLAIVGASGGVGSFAIEIATSAGIRAVAIARASSRERLLALGAEEVVDVGSPDLLSEMRRLRPEGFEGLLDVVSDARAFAAELRLVRPGGTAVTTVYAADSSGSSVQGVRALNVDLQPRSELLDRLARTVVDRHLEVPVQRTIRLDEAPAVVADGRAGRLAGKTVIRF